jgi:hypothetical protein
MKPVYACSSIWTAAARLREQARRGADGLKIWKPFGLQMRDQHGVLVKVDDPVASFT